MSLPLTAPARLPTDIDEDTTMISRRNLIGGSAILAGAAAVSGRVQAAAIPEAVTTTSPAMQPPLVPSSGPAYQPVVTLNGWTLPWRTNGDWKEFHLVAEPVTREIAPGMKAHLWGYNGQSPGPTLELVEGDKVRIFVTNKLPEHTTIHWHGMRHEGSWWPCWRDWLVRQSSEKVAPPKMAGGRTPLGDAPGTYVLES